MSGLGIRLNAFASAYQGGVDGARETRRDEQQVEVDGYNSKMRQSNLEMMPLKQEAAKLETQAQIEEGKTAVETAPARRAAAKTLSEGQSAMAPNQVKLNQQQLQRSLDKELVGYVTDAMNKIDTVAGAQEKVLGLAGKLFTEGNMTGLNRVMEHAIDAPIFPGLNGLGKPLKTEVADAPEGSVGIDGQPITGKALRFTFEDGSTKYVNPKMLQTAYQKLQGAEQQARVKIVKPGEAGIDTATGKVLFERDPVGMINVGTEEAPQWVRPGRGIGTGTGKTQPDPGKAAGEAWEFVAKNADTKMEAGALAKGARLTKQLVAESHGRIPPELAAEVALAVTADPNKVTPSIDPRTGKIDGVFKHPEQGDFVISRGIATANSPGNLKPEQMRTLTQMLIEGQDPQIRDRMIAAAFDPAAKKGLLTDMFAEYDKAVDVEAASKPDQAAAIVRAADAVKKASTAALNEKLNLIAKYSKAPKTDTPSVIRPAGGIFQRAGKGNAVDPASPAGKVQARQVEARAQSEARAASAEAERQNLSRQFAVDSESMDPLEFVRKYDAMRAKLSSKDAQALMAAEKFIR